MLLLLPSYPLKQRTNHQLRSPCCKLRMKYVCQLVILKSNFFITQMQSAHSLESMTDDDILDYRFLIIRFQVPRSLSSRQLTD